MKPKATSKTAKPLTMEWREHGRWIKSQCRFRSEEDARFHAHMIGAKTFRVIPARNIP